MKLQFKITVKQGIKTVAEVIGRNDACDSDGLTPADFKRIITTEQFLERLTGLRVHIDEVL